MKPGYIFKHVLGSIVFFAILFISAGTLNFPQGLLYVAIGLCMLILNYTWLRLDSELLNERSKPGADAKKWDKTILGITFLVTISLYIIAGLDSGRFHPSAQTGNWIIWLGSFLTATGQFLFLLAQKQNRFFSSTVRIQTERNHTVCDSGLYNFVRHPAYLGSVIQTLGFPLLFSSGWSVLPTLILLILLIVRTYLEDKTLMLELEGYSAYAQRTRYRLIPFIW